MSNKLTKEELIEATEWVLECVDTWRDLEEEDIKHLTNEQLEKGIERNFSGGIKEFKKACKG